MSRALRPARVAPRALTQRVSARLPCLGTVKGVRGAITRNLRLLLSPLGYLAFVAAMAALSAAAWLLGDKHELGYFSGRLAQAVWRYPEVTRRGVQVAWMAWVVLLVLALSPLDPLSTRWDEVLLVAVAFAVLWRRLFGDRRVER